MAINLSARVKSRFVGDVGVALGIDFDPLDGWVCLVMWEDGSLTAEKISEILVNAVDVAVIEGMVTKQNEELIESINSD